MYINFWGMMEADYPAKFSRKDLQNNFELMLAFSHNMNMALDMFEYEGLPDTCNARFLELSLLCRGQGCMYNSPEFGLINPLCGIGGNLNLYGEPATITLATYGTDPKALSLSGRMVDVYMEGSDNTDAPAVWFRDNYMVMPYIFYVMAYSEKMADVMSSITTAAKALKIPWILTCPPEMKTSLYKTIEEIDKNYLAIIGIDMTKVNAVELFDTNNKPEVLKALWEHYRNLQNELRTILGIQNQENTDKKERLLVDEINSNNQAVEMSGDIRLRARERFCENCNKVFGTNISVHYRIKEETENVYETPDDKDAALTERPAE